MPDASQPPHVRPPLRARLTGLAIPFALGLVAALGLDPFGLWGATVLALAVLLWRLARIPDPRAAFGQALAAGMGWFGLSLSWIIEPFLVEPEVYGWMAPFALILMALGGGLFWAVPVWIAHRIGSGWRLRVLGIAAALVLSDWLRGWIFTGLPWALTGHVWIDTPVAQLAAGLGASGLSALTLIAAALPALLWRPADNRAAGFAPGAILTVLLIGAVWAGGLARLARPLPEDRPFTLRLVQPNAEQALKWDPDWARVFYQRLIDLSATPGPRDLVIWPETAVNFLLEDATPVLPDLARAADAPLILGIQRSEGSRYYNSLVTLDRAGAVTGLYDKFHLVPFGEYIPWGDQLAEVGISAFAAQQGNGYSPGPGPMVMAAGELPPFQPLICYEAIFPQHLRGLPERPGWLLQITNDSWFGQFSGPYQHLAQARLRAVQSGLPLIRVANTGVSAVIDARGGLRQTLGLGEMGVIDAPLPGDLPETIWMRWGDGPVVALMLALLAISAVRRRR
ncbi:apolipoprotein N-acyltransferase [Paracoccus zhejiangensis]|uniref:Apolipoprotein N-acyltransferase n=1 Tax=Paracoccus zhejiangensis TaxID=1077935 RepID=A0A2H5EUJ2_9RHOB|nr:apolipoprotein N-acyltransferase [Paracoccus zhejiangensis]AUH62963.1 apolipoprotein N-acyltransferase [Paracoccus zhejiangensis]